MGCWHLLLGLLLLLATTSAYDWKPGCRETDMCGNVSIPYPFGIKQDCSREGFDLDCNDTHYSPPKLLRGNYEVVKISLEGYLNTAAFVASDCYDRSGSTYSFPSGMGLSNDGPFTFSNTRNKFTAIGCDTQAYIRGTSSSGRNFTSGCMSFCWEKESVIDGECSGIGCCQTPIPEGAKNFDIEVSSASNHSGVLEFNPCSFAFLIADDDHFKFNKSDLSDRSRYTSHRGENIEVPLVLDWAIGKETCKQAKENLTTYACKGFSTCYDSTNGPGYRCNCTKGYEGNPYLGCTDINECEKEPKLCGAGKCENTKGSYSCTPPAPAPPTTPSPSPRSPLKQLIEVILGAISSLLFVLIVVSWVYWGLKKRKLLKLKEKFFRKNGGLLLQQQITSHRVGVTTKIFSKEELERATNSYHESRIIGRGGYGTVYKGILPDQTTIAVKKSKIVDETQIEQFINEVFILSQINHRNVVKLLGCCLETQVPLLVYEFISNGTLSYHIHEARSSSLSLEKRLRIASETAGALSYLHSAASIPIFHRDVKSANILLDDDLIAKVSDFGASRLVPLDQTQITTLVQGTLGYLDPEYFQTGQLTEKSDVYSFGVVLAELLTGEKPICMSRCQEERNLSMFFVSSIKGNHLIQVLEKKIVDEAGGMEHLVAVAELAERCLRVKGEERPSMKEVAMELEGLIRSVENMRVQKLHQETHSLFGETSQSYTGNESAIGQDSLDNDTMAALEVGR